MNPLSCDQINLSAPYRVENGPFIHAYHFYTDYGVAYSISFIKDDLFISNETVQFIIANLNNRKSPRDTKLRDTIMAIIEEFFRANESTLLYICETGDGKQAMRKRLFDYWLSSYDYKRGFSILSSAIMDGDGIWNFALIIVRNDNPHLKEIAAEFMETVNLLSSNSK